MKNPPRIVDWSTQMNTFYAIDLVPNPKYRGLWCSHAKLRIYEAGPNTDLPVVGLISPAGFYLFRRTAGNYNSNYIITFNKEIDNTIILDERGEEVHHGRSILKLDFEEKGIYFSLAITPNAAHVNINSKNWEKVNEAILIMITQCWRFYIIEEALNILFEASQEDITRTASFSLRDWKHSKRFMQHDLKLRKLAQDIPHFEGLSVDPYRHCKDEKSAGFYERLVEELDMEGWCSSINDRTEILSDTYEALLDKLFYHKQYMWTLLVEVLIVLLLVGEVLAVLRSA